MGIYEKIRLDIHKYTVRYNHSPEVIIMSRESYSILYNEMWGNQKYVLIKCDTVMGLAIFVHETIEKDYILSDLTLKNTL